MDTPALPPEFHWRPHVGQTRALQYGPHMIAIVAPAGSGARSTRNVGTLNVTDKSHPDMDAASRFIAAWSAKWRDRIVAQYAGLGVGVPLAPQHRDEPAQALPFPVPARKPRRRR
ncbi:hypothetical protein ABB33_06690 [Stenotrophomonas acidaminiphila]|nr:hypothetical protein ABB33_06690 [Stenotrophomonas acidaminiphila]